ncbi:MAG TPA: signal peptide peptidase SppA [Gaiella sp.]|nr:signal peptide peptidase SppA [Gaiella sp.]
MARRRSEPLLLELDLSRGVLEAPPAGPARAFGVRHVPVLHALVAALGRAADDRHAAGLVAHVGQRPISLAHSSELRDAVLRFRASGKPTVAWTETFGELSAGNVGYHLATAFEEIWLQPSGNVGLTGIAARAVFLRDALDRLGVDPQLSQRYEYKTAADTFLRSTMTDAGREMARRLAESATETIVSDVAAARGLDPESLRAIVERAPLTAPEALDAALVDRLGYRDEVLSALQRRVGDARLLYLDRYGRGRERRAALTHAVTGRRRPAVAVVRASGPIHLGRAGASPWPGSSVGSDTLGATLRAAGRDQSVKAVVLRVDSGGGSYVASDAIRREVLALRDTGRPVVASMGTVAASGGYYVAMPSDAIVASPGTLTGSIGVLAGKQVVRDALARVGVRVDSEAVGAHAEMFSTQRPFTDEEWARLEEWLDRVYEDFTEKAASDRGMDVEALRSVARGRVWTGADALAHGLVDRLGGLEDAVGLACERAGLRRDDADVRTLPHMTLLSRMRPPRSSEQPTAASVALGDHPLLAGAFAALGLPPFAGVLTLPVSWQLS